MPASLTAAVAAAVLAVLWPLGRLRKPLIRDADTSAVVALNRAQIALVQSVDGAPNRQAGWACRDGHQGTAELLPPGIAGVPQRARAASVAAAARAPSHP
jgi:hypothetical protein